MAKKVYGTKDMEHPGTRMVMAMHPVFLGGKISLLKKNQSENSAYAITPRQARRIFKERHWSKIVGFHTRNVIHRSHEHIQLTAMEESNCDGLFAHPVVGKKKIGDYNTSCIIKSYEAMMNGFYPKNKVVFATFNTYSRYAGPREALFTAICRKNFGCSHFIVGRDHTGVGNFYHPDASHKIFDKFPELGMKIIKFDEVFYSKKLKKYVHSKKYADHKPEDKLKISGTEARNMFQRGLTPPNWFMRKEISNIVLSALKNNEEVFVKNLDSKDCAKILWFTGLSGSGKTTLANALRNKLLNFGKTCEVIDGDAVRNQPGYKLGFTRMDIKKNNKFIAELALQRSEKNNFVLISAIAPFRDDRAIVKDMVGKNLTEVFVDCPLKKCIERDTKGLYKKALAGKIDNFIGVSASHSYERPEKSDIRLKTDRESPEESVNKLLTFLGY